MVTRLPEIDPSGSVAGICPNYLLGPDIGCQSEIRPCGSIKNSLKGKISMKELVNSFPMAVVFSPWTGLSKPRTPIC